MSAVERLPGCTFHSYGFEAAAGPNPATNGPFTAAVQNGGDLTLDDTEPDPNDPYGTDRSVRALFDGSNSILLTSKTFALRRDWEQIIMRCVFQVENNAMSTTNHQHEVMTLGNPANGRVYGGVLLQWTGSALVLHPFIGHPSLSAHPAGVTTFVEGTNTTALAEGDWAELEVVFSNLSTGLDVELFVDGTTRESVDDTGVGGGPYAPHTTIPGGSRSYTLGSYVMDAPPDTHEEFFDGSRLSVIPYTPGKSIGHANQACAVGVGGIGWI